MSSAPALLASDFREHEYLADMLGILSDAAVLIDIEGRIVASNEAMQEISRSSSISTLSGSTIQQLIPGFAERINLQTLTENSSIHRFTSVIDNKIQPVSLKPFVNHCRHLLIVPTNSSVDAGDDLLPLVLECIPARVFWKDLNCRYVGCNTLFAQDAGKTTPSDLIGLGDEEIFPEEGHLYIADDLEVMRTGTAKLNIEEPQTTQSGEEIWLSTNKVPIKDRHDQVVGVMCSYTDITERVKHQIKVEQQARIDLLTKLPNRLALQEEIADFGQDQSTRSGGLLFIDLDHFKTVNDSLGHEVGDQLLKQVATRIADAVNDRAFIARLGGDEFSVFTTSDKCIDEYSSSSSIYTLAEAIRESILEPFHIGLHSIRLGVSIGITYFKSSTKNWADKFNEADIAMYEAKAAGRNLVLTFDENMRSALKRTHNLQSHLQSARDNNELHLHIQPQINSQGCWIGGEALLRWDSKELGNVEPSEFIPIAEQSGIIHSIGLYVFEQAFNHMHEWTQTRSHQRIRPLAVNVSARQFQRSQFVNDIKHLIASSNVDPALIQFELTESLLLDNQSDAESKLHQLAEIGFTLAIDDFGTGYSSLSYISRLPIKKLKIDQSFIQQLDKSSRQRSIVETIILMARNLEMSVIAEGVETDSQLNCLIDMGCKEFQGFLFDHPMPVADYIQWADSLDTRKTQ